MIDDPLKRLFFQHDLWAAFDYAAWYPDDWVFKSKYEPAAIALRNRLAKTVGRLALDDRELAALPDNYALAVKSKQYSTAHDPGHPEMPFLPPDLLEAKGSWVRIHVTTIGDVMTPQHFDGAGGRSAHVVFLRLPGGRTTTEQYLKDLRRDAVKQFPPGTTVAMVRLALTVDAAAKVRITPVTELVQIRVYRRIPADPEADLHGDSGEQDAYEFVLDRQKLFAGQHGLRAVGPSHYGRGQYAYGTATDGPLSPSGVQLLKEFMKVGMILDVTHLADQSFWQAMDVYDGPMLASHHNLRSLVPNDRQMTDEMVKELIKRNAVIGSAFDAWMMYPGWERGKTKPEVVGLEAIVDHMDRICQFAGNAKHIAFGTDLDGGFGTEQTPYDLDTIADLQRVPKLLEKRGYVEADVKNIMHGNWIRFFRNAWSK